MSAPNTPVTLVPYSATDEDDEVNMPHNVGHLLEEPTEIVCPACQKVNLTRIEREAVTLLQRFVAVLNFCLCCQPIRWSGRHDINHYCSKCGCFIGRCIALSWYKRKLFKMQRSNIEKHNIRQRFEKVEKEQLDTKKLQKFGQAQAAEQQ